MLPQSKPLFTGVQLSPLFVDRKTPPKYVPAKMWPLGLVDNAQRSVGIMS